MPITPEIKNLETRATDAPTGRWQALLYLSLSELLALSLWFSATAVLPAISREWQLNDGGRAGLTIAVQLGFIAGTFLSALCNLPDLHSPRIIMACSAALGAAANAALALWAENLGNALILRFLTGVCLAGVYPPAMKIMATWFQKDRGLAMGILIGALTMGSALPNLIQGIGGLPWRSTLLVASLMASAACGILLFLAREGPYRFPKARFDIRMALEIFRDRPLRLACFGYFGHMWELYAMWTWTGVFIAENLQNRIGGLNPGLATFAIIAIGAAGCYLGGLVSDRWGRTLLTMASLGLSGTCAIVIGLTLNSPPAFTLLIAGVWGFAINADSAQFSTAITELSQPAYVGTALTMQTCMGFALTLCSIWLIPTAVHQMEWRWAFAILAVGPFIGLAAIARLRSLPISLKLSCGRR